MDISQEQTVRLRPAGFDDAAGIAGVRDRNGMSRMSTAEWRRRWEEYPFREAFGESPIGWVLETESGGIVGSLDSVQVLYELDGKPVRAVTAAEWAVDKVYRRKSLNLMTAFLRQKNIDLWLIASASPATAQVLTAMKIPRMPIPDYGSPCFWAVRPQAFAKAALERRGIRGAALLSWPAGLALLARDLATGSGRGRVTARLERLSAFDDRFDELWQSIRKGPSRLRAIRTRAVLDWRFRQDLAGGKAVILMAHNASGPCGYAVLVRREDPNQKMEMFDVADLQVVGDDPGVTADLIRGMVREARREGAAAVKFMSGTPAKRIPAMALRPYSYRLPLWQQYFKVGPEGPAIPDAADAWDFSPFDNW